MTDSNLLHEPITVMFTEFVRPEKRAEYEQWSRSVHSEAKQFKGFLSVDVIRPGARDAMAYTTLMKFDNYENLKHWTDSTSLAQWFERLPELLIKKTQPQSSIGMQLWFDRPSAPQFLVEPPFWKSVVVGVICVYPLILALNWVLDPITSLFPSKIALLMNVVVLSGLLTYPVMPWVTRLLKGWLFADSSGCDS